jgi:Ala-tRNA(Pro) deacylase
MVPSERMIQNMNEAVLDTIRAVLQNASVPFKEIKHEATYTSEESARARGEDLNVGAKALLVKIEDEFCLFVLPADRKLNSGAVKRFLGVKKIRFATADELKDLTGLVPGSVPPFGKPILPFDLYADISVGGSADRVAFNAGSLTHSIVMVASDWVTVARPHRFEFAK